MTLDQFTVFLGWFTLLNYGLMIFSWLCLTAFRGWILSVHSRTTGVAMNELPRLYFQFYSLYKVLIMAPGLVPYLELRFFMG